MEFEGPISPPRSYPTPLDERGRAWKQYCFEAHKDIDRGENSYLGEPLLEEVYPPENWDDIRTGDDIINQGGISDGLKDMKVGQEKEMIRLKKKLIMAGQGTYDATPDVGDEVEVRLTGTLVDGTVFGSTGHFRYKLKNDDVIGGLDRAVMTMKKGEVAQFAIAPEYAFGSFQPLQPLALHVTPNFSLYYHVELVSFLTEKESYSWNTPNKIEDHLVEDGDQLLKEGKYVKAIRRLEKAAKYAREFQLIKGFASAANTLKIVSNMEITFCCNKMLEVEPENVKALYKRASSYIELGEKGLVTPDFNEVLRIEPTNRNAQMKLCIVENNDRKILELYYKRQEYVIQQIIEENRQKSFLYE